MTACLLCSLLLACGPGDPPDVDPPDDPGPWAVGHAADAIPDVGEPGRDVPIDVWYPVAPGDEADYPETEYLLQEIFALPSDLAYAGPPGAGLGAPLLVFSHGYQSINLQSTALTEALASHGFVVIAPAHAGNTQEDPSDDFETAASRRVPDVEATIAWAEGAELLAGQVDVSTVGVLGHSFGGMTSIGVGAGWAGADPIDGIDALMPISAMIDAEMQEDDRPHDSAGFSPEALATVAQPALLLGGTEDVDVPIENNELAFDWMTGAASATRVDVIGANHTHFANVCDIGDLLLEMGAEIEGWPALGAEDLVAPYTETCTGDAFPIDEAVRLQNLYAVAFFRLHLLGEADYGWWLTPEAAELEPAIALWAR